jgi:hypothetical protein
MTRGAEHCVGIVSSAPVLQQLSHLVYVQLQYELDTKEAFRGRAPALEVFST